MSESLQRTMLARRAVEDDRAAVLAGTGTHVDEAIGLEHDLRIVFDHHQRVAGIAQPAHHADHARHVARMQADGRFVEHEQRVDQRSAQRGGQVDALHLAAGQRARLAVQRQVAQAHLAQVAQPRADLRQQQLIGFREGRWQAQPREEHRGSDARAAAPGHGSCSRPVATAATAGFSRAPLQAVHSV